jgi:hypothetical protein
MKQNETTFIFYIDNMIKRVYLTDYLKWDGMDFQAKKFRHYKLAMDQIKNVPIPKGYRVGFTKVDVTKTYGWV